MTRRLIASLQSDCIFQVKNQTILPGRDMKSIFLLAFLLICSVAAMPFQRERRGASTDITTSSHATHIARIGGDTVVVITGRTYLFTVDTPEDQGLVSTGITAMQLPAQLSSAANSFQQYSVTNKDGVAKTNELIETGDRLTVTARDGKTKTYYILVQPMALNGWLRIIHYPGFVNTKDSVTIYYTAGQRSPDATVRIFVPAGIYPTMENTTVNVIGRGDVKLKDLATQSIGRTGSRYSYSKVGEVTIQRLANGEHLLLFTHLDLRPANGPDLKLVINNVSSSKVGSYTFRANYTTSKPDVLTSSGTGIETAKFYVNSYTIGDLERIPDTSFQYNEAGAFTTTTLRWTPVTNASRKPARLICRIDFGKTWETVQTKLDLSRGYITLNNLLPNKLYTFKIEVPDGPYFGTSNTADFYSGMMDIKKFDVPGEDNQDYTERINDAINHLANRGGGTLLFSKGTYCVRTIQLKSNVYLFIEKGAVIKALKGADAPEPTWFSDKKYRSGLSPTDTGPYSDPENYLTKQDVGHHYFRNSMFFAERLNNIKIIGNGLITGNGNLVTGDRVMNNAPDNRADKMFTFKLCTNIEIGGIYRKEDLWYDSAKDEPYYVNNKGEQLADIDNMLHIDRAGHFVLLATGSDNINVHDTYFGKNNGSNARDIYDFMGCNNVTVTNIYCKVSSDDIVKLGSDCSLGFTRPARNYKVRNVIGDTNCNLFQIGSETADDITDVCVDNIYVLGANKAGFSISTNDGAHIKNIHLNCGHTGPVHVRSKMYRTVTPFFISISNRARVLGADVAKYSFKENDSTRNELLAKNVNIGQVENIILNGIDIYEVYGGSSYNGTRWKPYDGTQRRATAIVAGYQLPDAVTVQGGLDFKLPDGNHTGYIKNISFNDVHILVKGGNPASDTAQTPPELGVGQYNVSNLKIQPSYGVWARHVSELSIKNSSFNYEKRDGRHVIFLDDVKGATISDVKAVIATENKQPLGANNSRNIAIENVVCYDDEWGVSPRRLTKTIQQ